MSRHLSPQHGQRIPCFDSCQLSTTCDIKLQAPTLAIKFDSENVTIKKTSPFFKLPWRPNPSLEGEKKVRGILFTSSIKPPLREFYEVT